ncbi:RNA-directed DNA polymerase, eukaryota, reverse transcriptase zinc-binding domain protein, partial [Tanacetum coccineum]
SLERDLSNEEIKRAIWDCGEERAPGPDGFTFKFFKTFWDTIQPDVVRFVRDFFQLGYFPKGCNYSFTALIPKVGDAKFVSEFRPICLIGCQYKIIGKLLANRLSRVIRSCVSVEQTAFIKGRNILDGPLILNECMAWYRKKKKKLMVFKVDFEKAYDSLRWDYLDVIMENIGFGHKWRVSIGQGVCVSDEDVADMAKVLGCGVIKLPMTFLGVPVGARLLSVGGGLTLLKSVVSNLPTFYMSLYLMPVTVQKQLESMRNSPNDLWVKVVKGIHGQDGGIGCNRRSNSYQSTWIAILKAVSNLNDKGIDLLSACTRSVGNGKSIQFWDDSWCGDKPLKDVFPRIFALDNDKRYGYCKNLKKTVKTGQSRTRDGKECTRAEDLIARKIHNQFLSSFEKSTILRNENLEISTKDLTSVLRGLVFLPWDRFNDLLRACPHHGFSELYQLDTFYNALNANDQDSLNSVAGGNFLDKMPRECLKIIESKSKVRNSRKQAVVAKVSSSSSTPGISPDVAALTTEVSELKNMMKTMLIDKQKAQAPVARKSGRAELCNLWDWCAHSDRNCPATDGNVYRDNIQEYVSQAAAANFNQGHTNSRPPMVANQIRPPAGVVVYQGPTIPTTPSHIKLSDVEPRDDKGTGLFLLIMGITEDVHSVVPVGKPKICFQQLLSVSVPTPNPKPSIPYPSRRIDENAVENANEQIEKSTKSLRYEFLKLASWML